MAILIDLAYFDDAFLAQLASRSCIGAEGDIVYAHVRDGTQDLRHSQYYRGRTSGYHYIGAQMRLNRELDDLLFHIGQVITACQQNLCGKVVKDDFLPGAIDAFAWGLSFVSGHSVKEGLPIIDLMITADARLFMRACAREKANSQPSVDGEEIG